MGMMGGIINLIYKGIYIIMAAGAAFDIEEPVAIDWITLMAINRQ